MRSTYKYTKLDHWFQADVRLFFKLRFFCFQIAAAYFFLYFYGSERHTIRKMTTLSSLLSLPFETHTVDISLSRRQYIFAQNRRTSSSG